jgi:hypothetical protein
VAERAEQAAALLQEMARDTSKIQGHAKRIKELEHGADDVVKSVMHTLRATWITPFDRTDIHELISRLDDVIDVIHAISERFLLFELKASPEHVCEFTRLIQSSCVQSREAVALLGNMKRSDEMLKRVEEMDHIESEGDALFRRAVAELYNNGGDPLTVMKWREMYDKLENVLDLLSDVGDAIEGVVLEYA